MYDHYSILKKIFGYNTFRPLQEEVITNILKRQDTLVVMPTGGGKSLCYQIPALLFKGVTVVVSPLISLMKDQVEQLHMYGIPAVFLNSSLTPQEYHQTIEHIKRGEVKLLYVSPETLLSARILTLLSSLQVDLLTIDEAHCISEWGHDFRPEYRQIAEIRKRIPNAVCMALTATATARVRQDIRHTLKFSTTNEFITSFNRENLFIEVTTKKNPSKQILEIINRYKEQSGIIYCFSRKQVDDLAAYLNSKGYLVRPYHAGLDEFVRHKNQEAFIYDDVQIIVATIAFGMGINKPNVRFVIHYDLPKSIENYYQEIGRAGRDGLPAHCVLLYGYGDAVKLNYFINQKDKNEKRIAQGHLNAIVQFAEDIHHCRRKPLLNYFGEPYLIPNCSNCDNCNSVAPLASDVTILAQKLLSCVKRAEEKFGVAHIVNILLGSKNEKILYWKHEKLSTYGIGKELDKHQWIHLAKQLILMGYIKQDEIFHTLSLTPKALDALRRRSPIFAFMQEKEKRVESKKSHTQLKYHRGLFAILRQKRKDLADKKGLPPHVIFSDNTLIEMSTYYPQSIESLLTISGVGQAKATQYGDLFLNVLIDYCLRHNIKEKNKELHNLIDRAEGKLRYKLVGEAYSAGSALIDLMNSYNVTMTTILDNLTRYTLEGNPLQVREDLLQIVKSSPMQQKKVFEVFDEIGLEKLKPIFVKLNEEISYDEIKVLRIIYMGELGYTTRLEKQRAQVVSITQPLKN